jgi:hypothetical protein
MSALARWAAFLAQVEGRHAQVITEAEAAGRQFIASVAAGGDYQPLSHQLMAVRNRLQDLETMIIDTWNAKVDDAVIAEAPAERERERAKGEAVKRALDDRREELEPRLLAELARQRFAVASNQPRPVTCPGCRVTHEAPFSYRALELACPACGGKMIFQPSELLASVGAIGAHAVAQETVAPVWRAMRAAEHRMRDQRPPHDLALVVDVERTQIAYWRAYLAERARFEPELGRDPAYEIRARMEQWYVQVAEYEERWVQAGRPRSPI